MTSDLLIRTRERRANLRIASSAPGRVWFGPELELWADCRLRDLSKAGAKVEISAVYRLPPRVILVHKGDDAVFEAVVKWRQGDATGLSFERRHPLFTCEEARLKPIIQSWRALSGV